MFFKFFCLWPLGALLFGSCVTSAYSIIVCVFIFFSMSSVSSTTSTQAHPTYLTFFWPHSISPRSTGSFNWRRVMKTIYGHYCHCYRGVVATRLICQEYICLNTNLYIHIPINISVCKHMYL